jgi:hypothetical protein
VGKDDNDRDLVEWAGLSYVVAADGTAASPDAIRRWRSS